MKSYEFLEMVMSVGVNHNAMGMVTLRTGADVKSVFEGHVSDYWEPEPGRYAYIESDEISDFQFGEMENAVDQILMTDERDMKHEDEGVPVMYMMFRIDDYPQKLL